MNYGWIPRSIFSTSLLRGEKSLFYLHTQAPIFSPHHVTELLCFVRAMPRRHDRHNTPHGPLSPTPTVFLSTTLTSPSKRA